MIRVFLASFENYDFYINILEVSFTLSLIRYFYQFYKVLMIKKINICVGLRAWSAILINTCGLNLAPRLQKVVHPGSFKFYSVSVEY